MATRQQRARGGSTPSQPRAGGVRPVYYEDFKPESEWKQEGQSSILEVRLPGFTKEQLKVSAEKTNKIRVRGERFVLGNKWSRFLEEFPIPEDCEITNIRAKYENGILTITMPKKKITEAQVALPKEEAKTTTTTTTHEAPPQPQPQPRTTHEAPPQPQPQPRETKPEKIQEPGDQTHHQKASTTSSDDDAQETSTTSSDDDAQKTSTTSSDDDAESKQEIAQMSQQMKEREEAKQMEKGSDRKRPPVGSTSAADRKIDQETTEQKARSEISKTEPDQEPKVLDQASTTEKESSKEGKDYPAEETVKGEKAADVDKEEEPTTVSTSRGGIVGDIGGLVKLERYKQAMKELAKKGQLNEERQLLVNMGTAALVIVALGAYVSYTMGSSGSES